MNCRENFFSFTTGGCLSKKNKKQKKDDEKTEARLLKPALVLLVTVSPRLSVLQSQQQQQSDRVDLLSHDEQGDAPADLSAYLELDCIIGSTDKHGELMFLVKW